MNQPGFLVRENCSQSKRSVVCFLQLQICDFIQSATVSRIIDQKVPFATFVSAWVGYGDLESILHKLEERNLLFQKSPPLSTWNQRTFNFKAALVLVL